MLEKTHQWNTTGNLINQWVVSRVIGSLGVAGASSIDALRETFLAAKIGCGAFGLTKRIHPLKCFKVKTANGKDALEHLRKAGVHIAAIFAALSLGVIAPSGLLNPAMVKLGFDLPLNTNLLNKIKTAASKLMTKRIILTSATLIGIAVAGALAIKTYLPVPSPAWSRLTIAKVCTTIGVCATGTLFWTFRHSLVGRTSKNSDHGGMPLVQGVKTSENPGGPTLRSHESKPLFEVVHENQYGTVTQRSSILPGTFVNLTTLSNQHFATISHFNSNLAVEYMNNPNRREWSDSPQFFKTMQEGYLKDLAYCSDKVVDIWSTNGQLIVRLGASHIDCVAPLQNGGFATASAKEITIWSDAYRPVETILITQFKGYKSVHHLAALQGGGFAALCLLIDNSHTLVGWSPAGQQTVIHSEQPNQKKSVAAMQDGGFLTGDIQGRITFYNADGTFRKCEKLAEDWTHIIGIKELPNMEIVAVGHRGSIHWLPSTGELAVTVAGIGHIDSTSIADDGDVMISVNDGKELHRASRNGSVVTILDKNAAGLITALPDGEVAMVTQDHCLAFFRPKELGQAPPPSALMHFSTQNGPH